VGQKDNREGKATHLTSLLHSVSFTKKKWKYFYFQSSRFLKEQWFLEGSQVSPVCPSGNSHMQIKTSREHFSFSTPGQSMWDLWWTTSSHQLYNSTDPSTLPVPFTMCPEIDKQLLAFKMYTRDSKATWQLGGSRWNCVSGPVTATQLPSDRQWQIFVTYL